MVYADDLAYWSCEVEVVKLLVMGFEGCLEEEGLKIYMEKTVINEYCL